MPTGMRYISTRGGGAGSTFEEVVLQGLAPDGGLFVPQSIPKVTDEELKSWQNYSFQQLSFEVLSRFIGEEEIPRDDLRDMINKSYKSFRSPTVTPLVDLEKFKVLELFHGPTYAFKDVALQMLGNFFEFFLARKPAAEARLTILGATSGDTGSAAIAGMQGRHGVTTFILFPEGRVSPIQERQMTTRAAADESVHCLSVRGTFDKGQAIVKGLFMDSAFRNEMRLGAVNSINFARVLAQIVYYFSAYYQAVGSAGFSRDTKVHFVVPTGNFGDILAGFYAKQMGLPIGRLVVATNTNDILYRFFARGEYHRESCIQTVTPSMDICVSSNFERFLLWVADGDTTQLAAWMSSFERTGKLTLQGHWLEKARSVMTAERASDEEILEAIKEVHASNDGYLLCPHSAVGAVALAKLRSRGQLVQGTAVCLATAHHAKFPAAVHSAVGKERTPDEPPLTALFQKKVEKHVIDATSDQVKASMRAILRGDARPSARPTIAAVAISVVAAIAMVRCSL